MNKKLHRGQPKILQLHTKLNVFNIRTFQLCTIHTNKKKKTKTKTTTKDLRALYLCMLS